MKKDYRKKISEGFYKDLFITFLGQIVVMVLSFVLNKIISNQYSVSDFGIYNLLKRQISVITFVMLMAMGITIPKYISEALAKKSNLLLKKYLVSSLGIILVVSVLISLVSIIWRNELSYLIFADTSFRNYMIPSLLYSFGSALIAYSFSYYRGINNFVRYAIINIIMQIFLIVPTILFRLDLFNIHFTWGIILVVYGLSEVIVIFYKNKLHFGLLSKSCLEIKELWTYSWPRVPGEFVLFAFNLVPLMVIGGKFGAEQVGYFSAAISINSLITPFFGLVGTILLPLVSRSKFDNTEKEVNQKIKILGYIYVGISILAILFVTIFGKYILIILLNHNYIKSMTIVKLTIFSILPNSIYLLLRNPIDAKSKFPYNTIILIFTFVIYTIALLLAPSIEMSGVAMTIAYIFLGGASIFIWIKMNKTIE
ncbi:lipopolysaccharide biosynthesis protein [Streptococcus massiliensis]|uniref:Polysaccharide biosynthesis protein n=1 Tax=Streptococcus massiliensis TaxID=313439 RepID=A0A380KX12_9STRE|nr:oligosaccharide flippase family protein [Streptococcus massiliensis]SUN76473.1 Polysaccharide biosynthesis protein [Streptococcus massiliensis]